MENVKIYVGESFGLGYSTGMKCRVVVPHAVMPRSNHSDTVGVIFENGVAGSVRKSELIDYPRMEEKAEDEQDLTKIDKPFGELDRATQLKLVELSLNGGELQYLFDRKEGWVDASKNHNLLNIFFGAIYRKTPCKKQAYDEKVKQAKEALDKLIAERDKL